MIYDRTPGNRARETAHRWLDEHGGWPGGFVLVLIPETDDPEFHRVIIEPSRCTTSEGATALYAYETLEHLALDEKAEARAREDARADLR